MFIPIRTDSRLRSTPYMNWLLVLANVLIFSAEAVSPAWKSRMDLQSFSPTLWQFFSYQFEHANAMHLVGNMLFLYIFGNNVNDKMGHLGYLFFYLAGGVMAGVCYAASQTSGGNLVGASGAIAAVTGAYLILFPRSNVTVVYWIFFFGMYELQSLFFILLFFAQDIFLNFAGQDNVAHVAHIGGTVFGASICLILVATRLLPRDQFDMWALVQRWNKRRQYRDLVARGYNPFQHAGDEVPVKQKINPAMAQEVLSVRSEISAAIARRDIESAAALYLKLKELDPTQILSRTAQTDVATQLYHQQMYPQAAEAYESLLAAYPTTDRVEQIELIVGVLYSRYLLQPESARRHLQKAIDRLHEGPQLEMAKAEIASLQPVA